MTYKLPSPSQIQSLKEEDQIELLDNLFEKHPDIHSYLIPFLFNDEVSFTSYDQLIEFSRAKLLELSPTKDLTRGIIAAHPRLGIPAKLSAHSNSEQKSIYGNNEECVDDIVKQFIELNREYEETFPGLRYVLFVNGKSKDQIFSDFARRINRNDYEEEVKEAMNAICDIAKSRVQKLSQ